MYREKLFKMLILTTHYKVIKVGGDNPPISNNYPTFLRHFAILLL